MIVYFLSSNHQKLPVFIRRDIDLRSHYFSHLLRYFSSIDTMVLHFYNCRHMFRPIGAHQYSQKLLWYVLVICTYQHLIHLLYIQGKTEQQRDALIFHDKYNFNQAFWLKYISKLYIRIYIYKLCIYIYIRVIRLPLCSPIKPDFYMIVRFDIKMKTAKFQPNRTIFRGGRMQPKFCTWGIWCFFSKNLHLINFFPN